jgi:drug/metabolite transporter (DMT)-like permease
MTPDLGRQRWLYVFILLGLGLGWGLTQPLGKIATSTGHPPFGLLFWQTVVAVVVLGGMTFARGKRLMLHREAMQFYVIIAFLGTLIPNFSFYYSIARLPSGIMSILISTIPLIALPIGLFLGSEKVTLPRLAGLLFGLAGVLMIVLPQSSLPDRAMLGFLPIAMIGPLFYAIESTYVARKGLAGMDPLQAMFGASVVAMLVCVPAMWATGQWMAMPLRPGPAEWALIMTAVMHALLYSSFIWLTAKTGAVFASQSSYIVTIMGIIMAMLILGERFSPWVFAATVVMLCGIALVRPRQTDREIGQDC